MRRGGLDCLVIPPPEPAISPLTIRDADPARDAAACAAIYAPHVEASPTSFEELAPSSAEIAAPEPLPLGAP
jgi:hypothetical protein